MPAQSLVDGTVSVLFLDFSADSLSFQVLFKLGDAVVHLILSFLELGLGHLVVLLRLREVELQLGCLTGFFYLHVGLPVLDTLCEPLLHETGVTL